MSATDPTPVVPRAGQDAEGAALRRAPARVTSRDVARAAGVSQNTVSLVLKGSTRISAATQARVHAVMERLGYEPNAMAAALRSRTTRALLFVAPRAAVHSHVTAELVAGATDEAAEHDYCIVVRPVGPHGTEAVELYRRQFVSGAVVLPASVDDPAVGALVGAGCPTVVMLTTSAACPGHRTVVADDAGGAVQAVSHLLSRGHRRLGLVAPRGLVEGTISASRIRGAQQAALQGGAQLEEAWVDDWGVRDGSAGGARLLQRQGRPTGIFAISDALALGVLAAAGAAGLRVPGDVAVVGFDNREWSQYWNPPLTTVEFPLRSVGRAAVRRLLCPEEPPEWERVPARLIVRGSS